MKENQKYTKIEIKLTKKDIKLLQKSTAEKKLDLGQVHKKTIDGVLDMEHGREKYTVRPYLLDLQSTNGTYLNGKRIEHSRYYELMDSDVIKFGISKKEYVIMKGMQLSKEEEELQEGKRENRSKGGVFGM